MTTNQQIESTPRLTTFAGIRPGDRVTLNVHAGIGRYGPEVKPRTGRAVLCFDTHIVVNLGGQFGTPGVCDARNYVKHSTPKHSNPRQPFFP